MILKAIIDNKQVFYEMAEANHGVFASREWLEIYGDALTLVAIYKDEQQLIGGFYYLNTKKAGFTYIKLPPYTPHCGLFYKNESKNKASQLNFTKELLNEVGGYLEQQKFTLCVLAFPSQIIDFQNFIWRDFKVIPNYTYRIQLNQSIETIVSNFDSKNRNAINKSLKEGLQVKEGLQKPNELYDYFLESLTKAGANVYKDELKNIFLKFASVKNSFALQACMDDKIIGTVFCIYDHKNCYYLLGGVDKAAGVQGINNLLILKSIEKAKSLGCEIFDFEGSMLKGVEKFFRSFGPDLVPYFTVNKAHIALEMALKLKKRSLF